MLWWKSFDKQYWLFFCVWENHLWKIICFLDMSRHLIMYLSLQWHHIDIYWVVEGINSESAKIQNTLIKDSDKELKLYDAVNFLEGAHQCQTDFFSVAGVLCSLLAFFGETTYNAPWRPSVKASGPTSSLCRRYPCCAQETFLDETCKVEADACFL